MTVLDPIDVFISSTCYDLVDLRAELAQFLKDRGLVVRISEDPESAFFVEPHSDSIVSCLKNVEASRAVVAVIDRRYGPVLPSGTTGAGMSATQAEIEHAQRINKPVFFFIREQAFIEYDRLRKDAAFAAKWVDKQNRDLWVAFLVKQFTLPEHANKSNWLDQFKNSADLKTIVLQRLVQHFPEYAGSLAMRGDRLVRMVFQFRGGSNQDIAGSFKNIGLGPAMNIRHGIRSGEIVLYEQRVGGVGELESVSSDYRRGNDSLACYSLYCEYENRFGDGYRIEVPIGPLLNPQLGNPQRERLLVRIGSRENPRWQEVQQ